MPRTPLSHPLALERLADARHGPGLDVLASAIAIATHVTPTLKPLAIHGQLDAMARDVRHLLSKDNEAVPSLRHVFVERWGFAGDRDDYHNPRNSYIDQVMARRLGLPIVLALVYVEAARRAGVVAWGIGLPGHFVAAVDPDGTAASRVYVDVFHRAAVWSVADCRKAVREAGVPWSADYLQPLGGVPWVLRMLGNLRTAYLDRNDLVNVGAVLEQMLLLDPENAARQGELGSVYERLEARRARDN